MDPRYQPAGMTKNVCHARHVSSGIYLVFMSGGSPLTTCRDDDWDAFGFAHLLKGI